MMYRPSNTVTERLKKLFKRRIADGEIAYLGDSILPGARVDVPGRPGYVYVRFPYGRDANGYTLFTPPTMARSSGAAFTNYPGTAVYVAVKYNNELEIVSAHYPSMDRAGINTATLNPLNQQSKFVYPWQLTYGLANAVSTAATSSALVTVKSFLHYVGNVFQTFQTPLEADKPDLSAYIPGTDEHRLVAIWVDTYTNTAEVTTSVTQPLSEAFNSTDIQELAAGRPPDAMPLKAFVLANGQVKVAQDPSKETDIRQHMAAPHIWGFPNVLTTRERVRPNRTLVTGPYTLSGAGDMAYEAGARHIIVHKNNFVGMAAPDADNDESEDYSVGSLWYDISTGLLYVAEDVTEGAAVWNVVESSAVGMTSFGVEGDSGDPFDIEDADILTFQGANGIVVSTDDATKTVVIDGSGMEGGITELTGDLTAGPGSGVQAATLATVNSNVGTFAHPIVTADGKGRITAISSGTAPVTSVGASAPISSTGGTTPVISLNDTSVTPGSYTNASLTVDQQGRLTAASSGTATLWTVFSTPGSHTWTKAAGVKRIRVICIGGGSGGGSGTRRASGSARGGGGGGASGGVTECWYNVTELPNATYDLIVGAGGAGAAAITTDATLGTPGTQGGDSWFGHLTQSLAIQNAVASPGALGAGRGGGAVVANGGVGNTLLTAALQFVGANGGNGGIDAASVTDGVNSAFGPGSGGGGGGISAANAGFAGTAGGSGTATRFRPVSGGGGTAGSAAAGGNGADGLIDGSGPLTFGSGGGGGGPSGNAGRNGGSGGNPGGGGGGGSGSTNGNNSGAGGNGADGAIIIIEYFA